MKEDEKLADSNWLRRHKKEVAAAAAGVTLITTALFVAPRLRTDSYDNRPTPHVTMTQEMEKKQEGDLLQGNWEYVPGVKKTEKGLLITPYTYTLIEQDGSETNQNNSPINFATHLEHVENDFSLTSSLKLEKASTAIVQLYGEVPIVADEFKIERQSVQLAVAKDRLTVTIWDGKDIHDTDQKPTESRWFTFPPQETTDITVTRQNGELTFLVNGKSVGVMPELGVFDTKKMWVGVAGNGEWSLTKLQAKNLSGEKLQIVDGLAYRVSDHVTQGLQKLASQKRPDFIVGSAMALGPLTTDPEFARIALDNQMFGGMTPENDMKMMNLQPQKGVYTFEKADALVKLATQNGLKIHGHTLVFGEANPAWFTALPVRTISDKQAIERIMKDHITTVVTHFGKQIPSWDVINEPMADYDDTADGEGAVLRSHKWYQAMGEDYIITALETAHKANPDALLFINDYGLESDGDRWDAFLGLMSRLKGKLEARNIPVDKVGVGFQSHVYEPEDSIDSSVLRRHIQQLGKLGYKVQISENDVYSSDGATVQAQQYNETFKACLNEKNCVAYRVWILSDRYNYWKDETIIMQGVDGLFDTKMKPRPAVTKMLES